MSLCNVYFEAPTNLNTSENRKALKMISYNAVRKNKTLSQVLDKTLQEKEKVCEED